MRTIQRDIVGAFIFSSDGKILLGHSKKGGVYQNMLVVPGGGIEDGETKIDAVAREILEETGIDISNAAIAAIDGSSEGQSEKTLRDTGEHVLVQMCFYDFKVELNEHSSRVELEFEDDFADASWYTAAELANLGMGPATKATLKKLGFI